MKHTIVLLYILLGISLANFSLNIIKLKNVPQEPSPKDRQKLIRGGLVYNTYCSLCHGENADGRGRLAAGKIPPVANLTISRLTDQMKEEIIRKGGEAVGRSNLMPPWGEELSEEQIKDLIYYLDVIRVNK
jgi:mono/diheme cytochrome c family protein